MRIRPTRRAVHVVHFALAVIPLIMLSVWTLDPFAHIHSISTEQQKQTAAPSKAPQAAVTVASSTDGTHQLYMVNLRDGFVLTTVVKMDASLRQAAPTERYRTPHPEPALTIEERQKLVMIKVKLLEKVAHYLWSRLFFYLDGYSINFT
jgi:hypothetical protein